MAGETTVQFERRCRHCGSPIAAGLAFCSKCGATAEAPGAGEDSLRDQLRDLFGADLDIEREIGRGGMAAVYAGFDPALQRRVAVKVLLPEISNDRGMADRFLREARTVASLQHPHVVTVYSVRSRDGVHAIVMQYVEGRSLDAALAERGSLPLSVAGMLLAQACDGLQHAHDRGVIHRDVKPANVLIEHDGRAIVSDFGIARRETGPRTTDTGLVVGTWAYMSPEQRAADAITAATDQYALGVMAFELLTGQLPFYGTPAEVMRGHMHTPPPSLRAIRPTIPANVEAVVHRMLAKAPADRFPSLRDAERAFRALIADEGKTTMQLAAYSQVQQKNNPSGSQVVTAVAKPAAPPVRQSAPTVRTSVDIDATQVAPEYKPLPAGARPLTKSLPQAVPHAPPAVPAKSGKGGALIGAGVGVLVLGIAFFVMKKDTPAETQPADGGARPTPQVAPVTPPPAPESGGQPLQSQQPSTNSQPARGAVNPSGGGTQGTQLGAAPITPRGLATLGEQPRATVQGSPTIETPTKAPDPAPAKAEPPPAPAIPAATRADAQRFGREFVTMLNQRRHRELAQVNTVGGDATLRAELIRLTETAPDFAAGFDRTASAPGPWMKGFETDFVVDLTWRGGAKLMRVQLYVESVDGAWRLAGMAVHPGS
jgi:serine/threonine protein kinase